MNRKFTSLVPIFLVTLLLAACSTPAVTSTPIAELIATASSPEPTRAVTAGSGNVAENIGTDVAARTPIPTPTPSTIERAINEITAGTPLANSSFLGLTVDDWVNEIPFNTYNLKFKQEEEKQSANE